MNVDAQDDSSVTKAARRIVSVDALRGFDMFWIVGADSLVAGLRQVSDHPVVGTVAEQLEHVPWTGFHFYDLIFPLFVFLMGVSAVFSLGRTKREGDVRKAYWRLFKRSALLIGLGIFYYGALQRDDGPEQYRFVGVLQRIGICYFFSGLVFLNFRAKGIFVVLVLLLGGYWALLSFVPVPEYGAGNFAEGENLTNYFDSQYLPGYKWDGDWDPEGLLSHLPAIGSGLLGLFGGLIIANKSFSGYKKVGLFVLLGAVCLGAGWAWGHSFPINKKLWTSSFVLYAGGWSYFLLAFFYLVIDVWKFSWWARPFVWIGMNPITIYLLGDLVGGYRALVRRVIHQPVVDAMGNYGDLVIAVLGLLLAIWIANWMYRRKIFIRI
ncbi:MAG: hypothetical protein R3C28_25870 [Pirellulaceae bacterium]